MLKLIRIVVTILIVMLIGLPHQAAAEMPDPTGPPAPLNEQIIRIPGDDPPAVTLEVTIFHPDGNGPFPLVIMNHGASNASLGHRRTRYRFTNSAFYFLSRGYAVALPMMRVSPHPAANYIISVVTLWRLVPLMLATSEPLFDFLVRTRASTPSGSSLPARALVDGIRWQRARSTCQTSRGWSILMAA